MCMPANPCPREDCTHNSDGACTFFVGDLYHSICLDQGTMYEPRTENNIKTNHVQ